MDSVLILRREERVVAPRGEPHEKERAVTKLKDAKKPIFHVLGWELFGNDICRLQLVLTDRAMETVGISGLKRIFRNPQLTVGEHVFHEDDMRIIIDEKVISIHVFLSQEDLEQLAQPPVLHLHWKGLGERKLTYTP